METIHDRFSKISTEISDIASACHRNPEDITIIAVSKKKNAKTVQAGIDSGIRHLGENYIQEAVEKIQIIQNPKSVSWHFIGHLQSNKAKIAVQYFDMIHSVDSFKLAREIDKHARNINKKQKILLQINIGEEQSKSGLEVHKVKELVQQLGSLENISLMGLMGMPPFFDEPEKSRPFFKHLSQIKNEMASLSIPNVTMKHLSMGMSNDFKAAIEEGSTMVRIGTAIFGSR